MTNKKITKRSTKTRKTTKIINNPPPNQIARRRASRITTYDVRSAIVARGRDLLAATALGSDAKLGDQVLFQPVQLQTLAGTRLRALSSLYGLWRPQRLTLTVSSAASAMTVGAVQIAWAPNPAPPGPANLLKWLSALPASRTFPLKQSRMTFAMPVVTKQRWLVNGVHLTEENIHGYIYCVVIAAPNTTHTVQLTFSLDWVVAFSQPQLQPDALLTGALVPSSNAQVYSAATTIGDVKVALLCWSGHNPVQYPGVKVRAIYLIPKGIKYYDVEENEKTAYYGVWARYAGLQGLYLFPTMTDAQTYQQSYNKYNLTACKKDSGWQDEAYIYLVEEYSPTTQQLQALLNDDEEDFIKRTSLLSLSFPNQ